MDPHVPGAQHYGVEYLGNNRPFSLAVQLTEVIAVLPRSVLEVGVGTGIGAFALRRAGLSVTTLDVQPELAPDLVGDVRAIPAADRAFDVSCCCQVLEHLPFGDLPRAVSELRRVTGRRLVLSVPDLTRSFGCTFSLASRGLRSIGISLPVREPGREWKAERLRTMGHYWEIGMEGVTARRVAHEIRHAGFARVRSLRVRELPWHRFFIADAA